MWLSGKTRQFHFRNTWGLDKIYETEAEVDAELASLTEVNGSPEDYKRELSVVLL